VHLVVTFMVFGVSFLLFMMLFNSSFGLFLFFFLFFLFILSLWFNFDFLFRFSFNLSLRFLLCISINSFNYNLIRSKNFGAVWIVNQSILLISHLLLSYNLFISFQSFLLGLLLGLFIFLKFNRFLLSYFDIVFSLLIFVMWLFLSQCLLILRVALLMWVMPVFLVVFFIVDFTLMLYKIIHSCNLSTIFLISLAISMVEAISHEFTFEVFFLLSLPGDQSFLSLNFGCLSVLKYLLSCGNFSIGLHLLCHRFT